MNLDFEQLAQLISGFGESLRKEMRAGFTRINERFDLIEAELDRQCVIMERAMRCNPPNPSKSQDDQV